MKKFSFLLSAVALATIANAAVITPDQALARLQSGGTQKYAKSTRAPKLLTTQYDKAGNPSLYIYTYSGDEGFMILSAEDTFAPLLGYSETGRFDTADIPMQLEWMLGGFTARIEYVRANPEAAMPSYVGTRAGEKAAITPLVKTTWDQTYPYNAQCPMLEGRRTVTGCVATAMAQVMKYWSYPQTGKGEISYRPDGFEETLSMNFAEEDFAWDNMINNYRGGYDRSNLSAVAYLMKACGYSVEMNYSPWESGASANAIANAMRTYFNYDKMAVQKGRSEFDSQEAWEDEIYSNLQNVGPVVFVGASATGGHCFLCDGYDGNGLFHINWGWSGLSDGYYLLTALNPEGIGTGGHYGGYNMSQSIVVGIMPPVGRLGVKDIVIGNAADDSGNVPGQGYIYRINEYRAIELLIEVRVSGGAVSTPIDIDIYETDPSTMTAKQLAYSSTLPDRLVAGVGESSLYTTYIDFANFDPGKLYTMNIYYYVNNKRTLMDSKRFAASAGVGDVIGAGKFEVRFENGIVRAEGEGNITLELYDLSGRRAGMQAGQNPSVDLTGLAKGVYAVKATDANGVEKKMMVRN